MWHKLWVVTVLLIITTLLAAGCSGHPRGLESPRWLTDAEKETLIEIALNTPEALNLSKQERYYEPSVKWAILDWSDNHIPGILVFDYDYAGEEIPDRIPESAEFYSLVEIYFGEPARYHLTVAVNPDTEKIAHVFMMGLKLPPTSP